MAKAWSTDHMAPPPLGENENCRSRYSRYDDFISKCTGSFCQENKDFQNARRIILSRFGWSCPSNSNWAEIVWARYTGQFRVNDFGAVELRHKSSTSAHYFSMVPKLTFRAEVHSLVPKLLPCRTSIASIFLTIKMIWNSDMKLSHRS